MRAYIDQNSLFIEELKNQKNQALFTLDMGRGLTV